MNAPWWYRARGYVIMLIFVTGFWGGAWLTYAIHQPIQSTFALTGRPLDFLALAVLLVLGCYLVRLWGSSYLTAATVWSPNAQTDALFVDGPFRYVRNPLYLGNILMSIGFGLLATPIGLAIIVIGHLIFVGMLAKYETIGMRATYGATYDAYCAAVPAFLPRLTPASVLGTTHGNPSLPKGIRAELFTGILVIGILTIVIFGSRALPAFATIFVIGWILQRVMAR